MTRADLDAMQAIVADAMAPVGTVTGRSMMGGRTLYCDGTVFAILARDELWFKADAVSDAWWDAAGCARFTYERGDGVGSMNYRQAPADCYDDEEALRDRAAVALEAGRRAPVRKRRAK